MMPSEPSPRCAAWSRDRFLRAPGIAAVIPVSVVERALGARGHGGDTVEHLEAMVFRGDQVVPGCGFAALGPAGVAAEVERAIAGGARAVIVEQGSGAAVPAGVRLFEVPDPLAAYRGVATLWRRSLDVPVVAVAGAAGKTTTKELIASMLSCSHRVWATPASSNGRAEVAAVVLGARAEHQVVIVEIGIGRRGAMRPHLDVVQPTLGVMVSLGAEHLDGLGDEAGAVAEECLLFDDVAGRGGTIAVNLDDPLVVDRVGRVEGGDRIGWTLEGSAAPGADGLGIATVYRGSLVDGRLHVRCGDVVVDLRPPIPGRHNLANMACATAVAHHLGASAADIAAGLEAHFRPVPWRAELREVAGLELICDYFNSNPVSVAPAVDLLVERRAARGGRAWACLGSMPDLAAAEAEAHRALADRLGAAGIDRVTIMGPAADHLLDRLRARWPGIEAAEVADSDVVAEILLRDARPGDVVLLKGSRRHRLEHVWTRLSAGAGASVPPA